MGTGLNGKHNILAAQHAGDRVHAAGDCLAQQNHVGLNAAPLVAEQLARPRDTSLDLVADQQDVVLVAQLSGQLQIIVVRNNNSGFTLNRLEEEGSESGTDLLKGLAQSILVIVRNGLVRAGNRAPDAGDVRPVVLARLGVGGQRDGSHLGKLVATC